MRVHRRRPGASRPWVLGLRDPSDGGALRYALVDTDLELEIERPCTAGPLSISPTP